MNVDFVRDNKQIKGMVVKTVLLAVGDSKDYTPYYYVRSDEGKIHFVKASICNEIPAD